MAEPRVKNQGGNWRCRHYGAVSESPELQTWIKERNPKTSREAAEIAEIFLAPCHPTK